MKLIKYIETVEVPTNSTTKTKFYFPELPNLRNKRILYINPIRNSEAQRGPSDLAVVSQTIFCKSFLVLAAKNKEIINRIPLQNLLLIGKESFDLLFDLIIDFPKSYIEVGSTAGLVATETFLFTFYSNEQIKDEPEYRGINVENIEVETTPTTIHKFYFPDHENLRGKRIQFIEYINPIVTKTPSGDNLVNATSKGRSFLTLSEKGQEIVRKIPIYNILAGSLNSFRIALDNIEIDFPNSYFEVSNKDTLVAGEKYFLNVYFYDRVITKKN